MAPKTEDPKTEDPKPEAQTPGEKPGEGAEKLTYDTWVGDQSAEVKTMLEENTAGLKTALQGERDARKGLEKQLREAAKNAEGEAKEHYTKLADDLKAQTDAAETKADFFVDAQKMGVTNLKLAHTVALADDLIDKKGRVNFELMKTDYPELFGEKPKPPKGHGGSGSNDGQPTPTDMNTLIRQGAGRQ